MVPVGVGQRQDGERAERHPEEHRGREQDQQTGRAQRTEPVDRACYGPEAGRRAGGDGQGARAAGHRAGDQRQVGRGEQAHGGDQQRSGDEHHLLGGGVEGEDLVMVTRFDQSAPTRPEPGLQRRRCQTRYDRQYAGGQRLCGTVHEGQSGERSTRDRRGGHGDGGQGRAVDHPAEQRLTHRPGHRVQGSQDGTERGGGVNGPGRQEDGDRSHRRRQAAHQGAHQQWSDVRGSQNGPLTGAAGTYRRHRLGAVTAGRGGRADRRNGGRGRRDHGPRVGSAVRSGGARQRR